MRRVDLNSTSLQAVTYQDRCAVLDLEFRSGAVYRYFGIPAQTFEELLRAESKGGYFNSHIRNRFAYARVYSAGLTAIRDSNAIGKNRKLTL